MAELVEEKAARIIPQTGKKWKVYFVGFSRRGWTTGAKAYEDEVNRNPVSGTNWVSSGIRLLDLEEVDKNLFKMTHQAGSS